MKILISAFTLLALACPLRADEITTSSGSKDDKVIVIEKGGKDILHREAEVKVESGSDSVVGEDAGTPQAAKREWNQACTEWKNELRTLNKNNLMAVSCGKPELKEEMRQSEKSYRWESTGTYKIRVSSSSH